MTLDGKMQEEYDEKFEEPQNSPFFSHSHGEKGIRELPKLLWIFLRYSLKFSLSERLGLFFRNISPKCANQYKNYEKTRFSWSDVMDLMANNVPYKKAISFPDRFNYYEIIEFHGCETELETILSYDTALSGNDITYLARFGVPNEIAKEYKKRFNFDGKTSSLLYISGILPEQVDLIKHGPLLDAIESSLFRASMLESKSKNVELLGFGAESIVFRLDDKVLKVEAEFYEPDVFERMRAYYGHNHKFNNVVNYLDCRLGRFVSGEVFSLDLPYLEIMELENIKGCNLHNKLLKSKLSNADILNYSAGIMNGLMELRKAGVWYHRDIRPANIAIDEEKNKAVILDLGIATTNRHALPVTNCRFGSPDGFLANDLISLGQVMYYMATGKHIFVQSESMSKSFSDIKEELKDYRNQVYADPTGRLLQQHLEQVDRDIQDESVRELTKACLTARRGQYKKMHIMFQEALK